MYMYIYIKEKIYIVLNDILHYVVLYYIMLYSTIYIPYYSTLYILLMYKYTIYN